MRADERTAAVLHELYRSYGYRRYAVEKFEEYDFYAQNRAFLGGESILTFTNTDGRLMALKPDVTLSILKNVRGEGGTHKVCYDERVYRARRGSSGFREIMQSGLECIGAIDDYCAAEVVMLAARSLASIAADYVLDVSDMGFLPALCAAVGIGEADRARVLALVAERNVGSLRSLLASLDLSAEATDRLCAAASLYAPIDAALASLEPLVCDGATRASFDRIARLAELLKLWGVSEKINLDLALLADPNYYDGTVLRGYVSGVPTAVLSGGRYDRLARSLGGDGAIGFAVYLDLLERFGSDEPTDVDLLIAYTDATEPQALVEAVKAANARGERLCAAKDGNSTLRFARKLEL